MSDSYNYQEGAIHNDNKKVLHITTTDPQSVGRLLNAFFSSSDSPDSIPLDTPTPSIDDQKLTILNHFLSLAERGDWATGITPSLIQSFFRNILNYGDNELPPKLSDLSDQLWQKLLSPRQNSLRTTTQYLIGYLISHNILNPKSAPQHNFDFFGNKQGSDNINKGRNGYLSSLYTLLDHFLPKIPKKH